MARALVNAGGPWVNDIIGRVAGTNSTRNVRLVKGSHIIVPKFWEGSQAYLVQNHDRRVIFINPYEGDKALIGTTDIPYEGAAEKVAADESEIEYLIAAVNRYGGDMPGADFDGFLGEFRHAQSWLPEALAHHYARLYGTRAKDVLNGARDMAGLGRHFGGLLHACEIDYLRKAEWAATAEDVLDRRTKHGLHLTPEQRAGVVGYMGT
jgi:glycerol-3-phosphate dehydrogenase